MVVQKAQQNENTDVTAGMECPNSGILGHGRMANFDASPRQSGAQPAWRGAKPCFCCDFPSDVWASSYNMSSLFTQIELVEAERGIQAAVAGWVLRILFTWKGLAGDGIKFTAPTNYVP